jgi:hypothetical protein
MAKAALTLGTAAAMSSTALLGEESKKALGV